ncbi:hypothetical protein NMA510612_1370 [Neisseria meningitidis]|uniref:Uncharacterized protein n=1 Tax=Neisseria meningitidis TaxID=487 RepID=X5EJ12_NEIME|nr:hypothetical protein NMA510612_1370 [Neisseria meningitidis]
MPKAAVFWLGQIQSLPLHSSAFADFLISANCGIAAMPRLINAYPPTNAP